MTHFVWAWSVYLALLQQGPAEQLQKRVEAAAEKASKACVFLGGGSGYVISADGYMLTNHHVASLEKKDTTVTLMDGRRLPAKKIATDPLGDVTLLKIECDKDLPFIEFGDSDALEPGQYVLAIGNPFNAANFTTSTKYYPTVSLGLVSAIHRHQANYADAVQTDAAVNPGNSGGMLVTLDAKLVGMNGQIATRYGNRVNSGVGYAISSVQLQRFLPALKAKGKAGQVDHGMVTGLGFDMKAENLGAARAEKVEAGSTADKAGFKEGDLIVGCEGYPVPSVRRLQGIISTWPAGSELKFKISRDGEEKTIAVKLDSVAGGRARVEDDLPPEAGWLGALTEDADGAGARITEVQPNSPAADASLQVGDVITRLGSSRVKNSRDLMRALGKTKPADTVRLKILRDDVESELDVKLGERPQD